jgi:hypothetical protein
MTHNEWLQQFEDELNGGVVQVVAGSLQDRSRCQPIKDRPVGLFLFNVKKMSGWGLLRCYLGKSRRDLTPLGSAPRLLLPQHCVFRTSVTQ